MQAVLLAGGLGTRLRPLTWSRPKALVPLLNRPMVLHVLDRLPASVDEVLIAANYGTEQLTAFFAKEDAGRRVTVVREKRPLGTAGCLKNLADRLRGTFLAFNADVVASVAVPELLAAHNRNGGIGTIALWEVEDPSAFGVVAVDGERITKFVEKPAKGRAPSSLVNAGIYAFEPEILKSIPQGKASLEREVFPKILRKGLYGFPFTGYWADAGTLEHFLHATEVLLRAQGTEVSHRATVLPAAKVERPVAVAADATVGGHVGPVVTVGASCVIGDARVSRSVLFDRVTVSDRAVVERSILGEGSWIGPRTTVRDSIIGDGVTVRADAEVLGERKR